MRIINLDRQTEIAQIVQVADTFWRRLKGLLGTKSLPEGEGLVIRPCNSVHTFGMNYAIDVLFIDNSQVVVKVIEGMVPSRVTMALGSAYVIELPNGAIRTSGTKAGDRISLIDR